jgi:hypothetical protein
VLACTDEYKRVGDENLVASLRAELDHVAAERDEARRERDEAREAHAFLDGCVSSIKSNHARSIAEQRRLKEESLAARAVVEAARALVNEPTSDELSIGNANVWTRGEIKAAQALAAALSAYDAAASAKGGA